MIESTDKIFRKSGTSKIKRVNEEMFCKESAERSRHCKDSFSQKIRIKTHNDTESTVSPKNIRDFIV
jgi:hypothetical protein